MKNSHLLALVAVVSLSANSFLYAQGKPAVTRPTYVLKFQISDTFTPEVTVKENDKFNLSVVNEGVTWNLKGTNARRAEGMELDVDIASKQVVGGSSASSQIHSHLTLNADGQPAKLGSASLAVNGSVPRRYDITAVLNASK